MAQLIRELFEVRISVFVLVLSGIVKTQSLH
jgi:hypothetical protein